METRVTVESGRYGRLVVARLRPNEDLVESLEQLCLEHGIQRAVVRGVVGSLIDARFKQGRGDSSVDLLIPGPGVEILNVFGEIDTLHSERPKTTLSGMVADPQGQMYAGRFCRSGNLSFITIEASLHEWLPDGRHATV